MPEIKNIPRAETGVMQFKDDWPGVFIRGDNAAAYAMALQDVLANHEKVSPFSTIIVQGLVSLLQSSDTRTNPTPQKAVLSGEGYRWCSEQGRLVPISTSDTPA